MQKIKRLGATVFATVVISVVGVAPASAQPVFTGGLVNVNIGNVNVPIGVAANLAANLCGGNVQVGVLASQVARDGTATCTAETGDAVVLQRIRN